MQYATCLTYFLNQDFNTLTYCRTEWVSAHPSLVVREETPLADPAPGMQSKLVTWLASDCSAGNGSNGGLCVATDQRWYVQ